MPHLKHILSRIARITILGTLLLSTGVLAQEDSAQGSGVITYYDHSSAPSVQRTPYPCPNSICARFYQFSMPTLFESTPFTEALLVDVPALPQQQQTYHIAEGAELPNGEPLTAYDAIASVMAGSLNPMSKWRIDDEQTFTLWYANPPTCYTHRNINVTPFAFRPDADVQEMIEEALTEYEDGIPYDRLYSLFRPYANAQNTAPQNNPMAAYAYVIDEGRRISYAERGDQVIVPLHLHPDAMRYPTGVEAFLQGQVNLLMNPPVETLADLRATPDIQIYEAPGNSIRALFYNPAVFAPETTAYQSNATKLYHPALDDPRVREALTYIIDVETLIQRDSYGASTPANGFFSPSSSGYDPDRPVPSQNIRKAERLLDEAGWPRMADGKRACYQCLTGKEGEALILKIIIPDDALARVITEQFDAAGIPINLHDNNSFDLRLALVDVNRTNILDLFTSLYGSGPGPSEIQELLTAANTVPDCNLEDRFAIYQQVQTMLDESFRVIWLDVPHEFYAWRGIYGIDPRPNDLFWNVTEWRATR